MKVRILILMAALVAAPAIAEDVTFKGRTLDIGAGEDARPILRMSGTQYVLPRSQEQLVSQAQACLDSQNGVKVESADAAQGLVVARVDTGFRAGFSAQQLRSRLELVAGENAFRITESDFALSRTDEDGGVTSVPLMQNGGLWQKGLEALMLTENKVVDCLFR